MSISCAVNMENYQKNAINLKKNLKIKRVIAKNKVKQCKIERIRVTSLFHQPLKLHTKKSCRVQGKIIKKYHFEESNLSVLNFLLHYNPKEMWKGPCSS